MKNILLHRTEVINKRCQAVMRCARNEKLRNVVQDFKKSGLANR